MHAVLDRPLKVNQGKFLVRVAAPISIEADGMTVVRDDGRTLLVSVEADSRAHAAWRVSHVIGDNYEVTAI